MQQKHAINHSIHVFAVGEYASVRIPRIDCASTDLQRLPCVIIQVISKGQRIYRIRSKHGVLRACFHASDLEPFAGTYSIPTSGWQNEQKITLHEAAHLTLEIRSPKTDATASQELATPADVIARRPQLSAVHTTIRERHAAVK